MKKLFYLSIAFIIFLLGASSARAEDPYGWLDVANCNSFAGWTCDADNYNKAIDVHFYANGPAGGGGTIVGSITANINRSDLPGAGVCGGNPNHGYSFTTPNSLKDGQNHAIYAYAINHPSGNNPQLSGSPKTLNCPFPRNAQYVSRTCPPSTMNTGQSTAVSIIMKNTGENTWTTAGNYSLGSQNPENNGNWGTGRLSVGSNITTNASKTFSFTAVAPATPGVYNFQWKMVQDGVAWFGDTTPNCSVNVVPLPTSTPIPTSTPTPAPIFTPTPTSVPLNLSCFGNTRPIRVGSGLLSLINPILNISTTNLCLQGPRASIPDFSIPSYPKMKSLYFDQIKTTSNLYTKEPSVDNDINQGTIHSKLNGAGKDVIMHTRGNITINGNLNLSASKAGVFFTDKDLIISKDIKSSGPGSASGGLVFIVQGNARIEKDVKEINAVIITFGEFCSASNIDGSCPLVSVQTDQLLLNGSIISLSSDTNKRPKFMRVLANNSLPAEKIVFQPKYLVILKDIFSRNLTMWKEIQ